MAKTSKSWEGSLQHDDVSSHLHQKNHLALPRWKLVKWVGIAQSDAHEVIAAAPVISVDSLYFAGLQIPEVKIHNLVPVPWDASGTLASFSQNSQVAALREFRGTPGGKVSLAKSNDSEDSSSAGLTEVNQAAFVLCLAKIRDEATNHHRWTAGRNGKMLWKKVSVRATGKASRKPSASFGFCPKEWKGRQVCSRSDLQRYTVTCHPALARALSLILDQPNGQQMIRRYMANTAVEIVGEIQKVTGRMVLGLSTDFDSNLASWKLWHCGTEKVIYQVNNSGRSGTRYRRTRMNLNSTGSGVLRWHRARLTFERFGMDFSKICKWTQKTLDRCEAKCLERQGRKPGDWVVGEVADTVLERLMADDGWHDLVKASYMGFIEHEKMKYEEG